MDFQQIILSFLMISYFNNNCTPDLLVERAKKRITQHKSKHYLHISKNYCTFDGGLSYFLNDVIAFVKTEFLTDLGFALVDGLQTLTREHVDLFRGEVGTQQTAELQFLFVEYIRKALLQTRIEAVIHKVNRLVNALPVD